MVQLCPRCQRANPSQAAFCYFDGCLLQQGGTTVPPGTFLQEFVFPSGRRCRNFDELAQGIYHEWEDARELLADGSFVAFLAGLGRGDLVRFAREAQAVADRDIALTNFVDALPASQVQGPRLGLNPRRLFVGPLPVDEQRSVQLRLLNEGQGVLQGKISGAEGAPWLRLAAGGTGLAQAVHAAREQTIAVQIDTSGLVVGQNYSGKLVVVSNGGIAEVPVRLELTARPFLRPPYQGAQSPQDLARKMRDNPHPAVPMLESGEIARWFRSNGWTYPIAGATAPGLASVQQFFEELGLARAPLIHVSQQEFHFQCRAGDVRHDQVVIRSPARKLVYARAESDQPWLEATTPNVSGQVQAAIDFTVDTSLMAAEPVQEATLRVIANAGQTFPVRVRVELTGKPSTRVHPSKPTTATLPTAAAAMTPTVPNQPAMASVPAALPLAKADAPVVRRRDRPTTLGEVVIIAALLAFLLRLLFLLPGDVYARLLAVPGGSPTPGALAAWLEVPSPEQGFLSHLVLAVWWVGALAGVIVVWRVGGRWADVLFGAVAGAMAGVVAAVTLGIVVIVGDILPREVLGRILGTQPLGPATATPLWMATALGCWLVLGGVVGLLLGITGRPGRRLLARLANPVSRVFHGAGFHQLGEALELRV
ncbi:MAG: hypothetical protein U0840_10880 [Gemmataceae bacterium]